MLPNRVVGYSPDLARIVGGATTGLFLSQLLFLSDKGHNPDGWVYKSEAEMGRETSLTKREQQTARRKLLSLGVIAIERRGFKFTYHFKVIWERLYQVIEQSLSSQTAARQWEQTAVNEKGERLQTVPTDREQTVSTELVECQQNVSTQWRQTVPAHNRDYNTEKKRNRENDQRERNGLAKDHRKFTGRPATRRSSNAAYRLNPYRGIRYQSEDWRPQSFCYRVA
jgi:hypothetical protein